MVARTSRIVGAALGFLLWAGCARSHGVEPFPPVDAAQRVAVLEAVGKLRDAFNVTSGCEAIYNGATPRLQSYTKEKWLTDCSQLKSDLGSWQTFRPQLIERCGMPDATICMLGDGAFAKGGRMLELIWSLDRGRAQLLSIAWPSGTEWIRIPPLPNPHRYHDTPPVPGKIPSNQSG